jgi:hypothetical protein
MKVKNIGDITEILTTRNVLVLTAVYKINNFWDMIPFVLVNHYKYL